MTNPKIALYLRLSREDGETGQSQSIQSQRQVLEQFLQGRGWQATEIYMDAGVIIGLSPQPIRGCGLVFPQWSGRHLAGMVRLSTRRFAMMASMPVNPCAKGTEAQIPATPSLGPKTMPKRRSRIGSA